VVVVVVVVVVRVAREVAFFARYRSLPTLRLLPTGSGTLGPSHSSAPDRMLSPIHALLGEEFQDWLLPTITGQMKVATLAALRATCKDGRRAATAEYDPVEAHAFFRAAKDEYFREGHGSLNTKSDSVRYALAAVVRTGRLRAYEQHAIRWRMHLKYEHAAEIAAEHGHIHILDWMYNKNTPRLYGGADACRGAARGGQLEALKWLRAQLPPAPWTEAALIDALGHGHLHIVEWLAERGCPGSHHLTDSRFLPRKWLDSVDLTLYRILWGVKTWREGLEEEVDAVRRVVGWLESRMEGCHDLHKSLRLVGEHLRKLRSRALV